ncbi:MAG: PmoA family protein [Cytophagales bacterium]|nr:PmoA family protein [Armatimonadota bacterium]
MTLQIKREPGRITFLRTEDGSVLLVQNALPDTRPFLHPIATPDGAGILTEDSPPHHPWQHGLYVGMNAVNGVGFWTERERDGTFHPAPLTDPVAEGSQAEWKVTASWRDPSGDPVLTETQEWKLADQGSRLELGLRWTLAAEVPSVSFGRYDYGGLFLRMPYRSDADSPSLLTSEGATRPGEAEGKRARWVALAMTVGGKAKSAGIAILDHPGNPEHPTPWRVDEQYGIGPSRCISGAWQLEQGKPATARYRIVVFTGEPDAGLLNSRWQDFCEEQS